MIETALPTKFDSVIDSRDVIAAIRFLDPNDGCEDCVETLAALQTLATQGDDATEDWPHGATLVRDSYFVEYAQELADECGFAPQGWPTTCIDWEQAARELRMDYTPIEFAGVTYWVR